MGWVFPTSSTEEPGADPDPLNGAKSIRELYELASTNYSGKYTVPVCVIDRSEFFSFSYFQIYIFVNFCSLLRLCCRCFGIRS